MDGNGFRIDDNSGVIHQPSWWTLRQETTRETEATKTTPVPSSRYSAYAAPMEDGRLVTDYRQACVTRAPPGTQYAVKQWTIHNADEIVRLSRARQVQNTGQALGSARTGVEPYAYQQCSTEKCHFYGGSPDGIGLERIEPTPELFGTFTFAPDTTTLSKNKNHIKLNELNEYGRNTSSRWSDLY